MRPKISITLWASLLMMTALCGCSSLINPSAQIKHQSFAKIQEHFTADQRTVTQQTYLVLAGGGTFEISKLWAEATSGQLSFTNLGPCAHGMAIGLDPDGYLLTAGHVLPTKMKLWILGWFEGRIDCRPARLVFRNDFKAPADLAVLKVEGKLDHYASFGSRPLTGDRVFAVVRNRNGVRPGGDLALAGGTVLGVRNGPAGSSVALVDTDVPQCQGDSGGPLLSSNGQLIAVFTVIHYGWPAIIWKRWTTCVFPNEELVQSVIAADRASAKGTTPQGEANGKQSSYLEDIPTSAAASRRSP